MTRYSAMMSSPRRPESIRCSWVSRSWVIIRKPDQLTDYVSQSDSCGTTSLIAWSPSLVTTPTPPTMWLELWVPSVGAQGFRTCEPLVLFSWSGGHAHEMIVFSFEMISQSFMALPQFIRENNYQDPAGKQFPDATLNLLKKDSAVDSLLMDVTRPVQLPLALGPQNKAISLPMAAA